MNKLRTPSHAVKRQEGIRELIFKFKGENWVLNNATKQELNILHDLFTDLWKLAKSAAYWEDFCRETNHDPNTKFELISMEETSGT